MDKCVCAICGVSEGEDHYLMLHAIEREFSQREWVTPEEYDQIKGRRMRVFDREGKPMSWSAYLASHYPDDRRHEGGNYRVVAQTTVGAYWVSTVWLGIDHDFGRTGKPMIFETMVLSEVEGEDPDGLEYDMRRYATEAEARAGHDETVLLIRATTDNEIPAEEQEKANGN